jgi:hypothetical protein
MTSPTQRSLKLLRARGWTCWVAERWNPFAHVRQDMGGFADIVAWKDGCGVLAVQTTSASNLAARRGKVSSNPAAKEWFKAGGILMLHGWRKVGERGKRKAWAAIEERMEFFEDQNGLRL